MEHFEFTKCFANLNIFNPLVIGPLRRVGFYFWITMKIHMDVPLNKIFVFSYVGYPPKYALFPKKANTVLQKKKMTGYEADQSTMLFHVVIVWELELFPDLEFGGCLLPQCCPK